MQYLDEKYLLPLDRGDVQWLTDVTINPRNGKNFTYNYIRKVLQGGYNNVTIMKIANEWVKNKEEFRKMARQLCA
jgi:hypothetical protein